MSLSCGFFNSEDGDRQYFNQDLSNFLEGLIEDGIYEFIDDKMMVTASAEPDMHVLVGKGRAWFNQTWTKIDSAYQVEIPAADAILNRIDAICLTVNHSRAVRDNYIEIISGTGTAAAPTKPTVEDEPDIYRHVLAYVTVSKGVTQITQANIENRVGMGSALFSKPIWQNVPTTEEMVAQWQVQFDEFMDHIHETFDYDAAGNLQTQIDSLRSDLDDISSTADNTPGGTANSTALIQSGAVRAGINAEATARATAVSAEASARNSAINQLRQDFTDGCNAVYNALVSAGVTPTEKTPEAFRTAMQTLFNQGRRGTRTVPYVLTEISWSQVYYGKRYYCELWTIGNSQNLFDDYATVGQKTADSGPQLYWVPEVTPPNTSAIVRQTGETGWNYLARFLIKLGVSVTKENGDNYGPNSIKNAIPNIKTKGQSYPTERSISWQIGISSVDPSTLKVYIYGRLFISHTAVYDNVRRTYTGTITC